MAETTTLTDDAAGRIDEAQLARILEHVPNCRYGCIACETAPALVAESASLRRQLDIAARELQKGALDTTGPMREIAGLRAELDALAAERDQLRAELQRLRHGAEAPSGRCEDCGCCTASGCHTGPDSTCPTDRLGDSVCPCTGD
jgi:hypothetical protein